MRKEYANWQEYETKNKPAMIHPATRHNRRTAKIKINTKTGKKEVRTLEFIRERAKYLPKMTDKSTGKDINHVANMENLYMNHGVEAVNDYIRRVRAVILRDKGKNIFIRIGGWISLKYYKLLRLLSVNY